jgi:hypothetical protein
MSRYMNLRVEINYYTTDGYTTRMFKMVRASCIKSSRT